MINAVIVTTEEKIIEMKKTSPVDIQKALDDIPNAVRLKIEPYEYQDEKFEWMLVGDSSLVRGLDLNITGTHYYRKNTLPNSHLIAGDVIFCNSKVWY